MNTTSTDITSISYITSFSSGTSSSTTGFVMNSIGSGNNNNSVSNIESNTASTNSIDIDNELKPITNTNTAANAMLLLCYDPEAGASADSSDFTNKGIIPEFDSENLTKVSIKTIHKQLQQKNQKKNIMEEGTNEFYPESNLLNTEYKSLKYKESEKDLLVTKPVNNSNINNEKHVESIIIKPKQKKFKALQVDPNKVNSVKIKDSEVNKSKPQSLLFASEAEEIAYFNQAALEDGGEISKKADINNYNDYWDHSSSFKNNNSNNDSYWGNNTSYDNYPIYIDPETLEQEKLMKEKTKTMNELDKIIKQARKRKAMSSSNIDINSSEQITMTSTNIDIVSNDEKPSPSN